VIIMWAWESSAPGAAASGVCADAGSAQRAASAWMRANGADAGLLEEVLLVLGAGGLLTRHERTGRVLRARRYRDGWIRWRRAAANRAA
jgi:hypothetical protein